MYGMCPTGFAACDFIHTRFTGCRRECCSINIWKHLNVHFGAHKCIWVLVLPNVGAFECVLACVRVYMCAHKFVSFCMCALVCAFAQVCLCFLNSVCVSVAVCGGRSRAWALACAQDCVLAQGWFCYFCASWARISTEVRVLMCVAVCAHWIRVWMLARLYKYRPWGIKCVHACMRASLHVHL